MIRLIKEKINNWRTRKDIQAFFEPDEEFLNRSRQLFLSAVEQKYGLGLVLRQSFNHRLVFKLVSGVAVFAFLSLSGVVAYADQKNVGPTSPLYDLKILGEKVQVEMAPSSKKMEVYEKFAQRRYEELTEMRDEMIKNGVALPEDFSESAVSQESKADQILMSAPVVSSPEREERMERIKEIKKDFEKKVEGLEEQLEARQAAPEQSQWQRVCDYKKEMFRGEDGEKSEKFYKFGKRCDAVSNEESGNRQERDNEDEDKSGDANGGEVRGVQIKKQDSIKPVEKKTEEKKTFIKNEERDDEEENRPKRQSQGSIQTSPLNIGGVSASPPDAKEDEELDNNDDAEISGTPPTQEGLVNDDQDEDDNDPVASENNTNGDSNEGDDNGDDEDGRDGEGEDRDGDRGDDEDGGDRDDD